MQLEEEGKILTQHERGRLPFDACVSLHHPFPSLAGSCEEEAKANIIIFGIIIFII